MLIRDILPPEKIREVVKEISGFKKYKSTARRIIGFGWRSILSLFIALYCFTGITPFNILQKSIMALESETETAIINFYTSTCEGDWQNSQNAQGAPQVFFLGDANLFTEENSAVYKNGTADLVCKNFSSPDSFIPYSSSTFSNILEPVFDKDTQTEGFGEEERQEDEEPTRDTEEDSTSEENGMSDETGDEYGVGDVGGGNNDVEGEGDDEKFAGWTDEEKEKPTEDTEDTTSDEETEAPGEDVEDTEDTEDTEDADDIKDTEDIEDIEDAKETEDTEETEDTGNEDTEKKQGDAEQINNSQPEIVVETIDTGQSYYSSEESAGDGIDNAREEESYSFFGKIKNFFRDIKAWAQEKDEPSQFETAKINISFAIKDISLQLPNEFQEEDFEGDAEQEPTIDTEEDSTSEENGMSDETGDEYGVGDVGGGNNDVEGEGDDEEFAGWTDEEKEKPTEDTEDATSDEEIGAPGEDVEDTEDAEDAEDADDIKDTESVKDTEDTEDTEDIEGIEDAEGGDTKEKQEDMKQDVFSEPTVSSSSPVGLWRKIKSFFNTSKVWAEEEIKQEIKEVEQDLNNPDPVSDRLGNKIIIWYSLDEELWWQLAEIDASLFSNFSNGGYLSYEAPFLKNLEDIQNLHLKFTGTVKIGDAFAVGSNTTAYLDSAWVEVEYQREKEALPIIRIEDSSLIFSQVKAGFHSGEDPVFTISEPDMSVAEMVRQGKAKIIDSAGVSEIEKIEKEYAPRDTRSILEKAGDIFENIWDEMIHLVAPEAEAQLDNLEIKIFNPRGEEVKIPSQTIAYLLEGKERIETKLLNLEHSFMPGEWKIEVKIRTEEAIFITEQDFTWGVLAINVNKSYYLQGEQAYIQMAALKNDGHTMCDANLSLEITSPRGIISYPEIEKSGRCLGDNITDEPDYFTYYQVGVLGSYRMKLINLSNGYEIEDSFEVRGSVPFDIERIGPTRIFPWANYGMKLKIKVNQDFEGQIVETVPASFIITATSSSRQIIRGEEKEIVWDVDWKANEEYELQYQFDAPDISPYLYLLGPLKLDDSLSTGSGRTIFQESRSWQIAADASTSLYPEGGDGAIGSFTSTGGSFYTEIDDWSGGGSEDDDTTYVQGGNIIDDSMFVYLTDLPSDFAGADTVEIKARHKENSSDDDTINIYYQIYESDESSAITDETTATLLTANTYTTDTKSSISITGTNTKASWDGARIRIRQVYGQVKGPDTASQARITAIEVNIVYTAAVITVEGTVFSDEGSTALLTGPEVKLMTNGVFSASTTASTSTGAYTISGVSPPSAGDVFTVYLDGAAEKAVTVTRYNTGSPTGIDLYQNRLIVRTEDGTAITNTNLNQWDGDDDPADIFFTANFAGLDRELLVNSGKKLIIWQNDSFTPGGPITLQGNAGSEPDGDLLIGTGATLTAGGNITLAGSWIASSTAIFSCGSSGSGIFNATTTGKTIRTNGSPFYNLIFNGSGGGWDLQDAATSTHDVTITAGTLSGSNNITVNGGDATGDGTINLTGGTFLLDGTGNFGGATGWTFNHLTFGTGSAGTTTATSSNSITVDGNLTVADNQTLTGSKSFTVNGGGTTGDGTINLTGGTFLLDGTGNFGGATNWTFDDLTFGDGSGTATTTAASTNSITVDGGLTVASSQTFTGSKSFTVNGGNATGNGTINLTGGTFLIDGTGNFGGTSDWTFYDLTFGDGSGTATTTALNSATTTVSHILTIDTSQILNAGSSKTWVLSGSGTPFVINGTFNYKTSIFKYTANADTYITDTEYYDLELGPGL